jgi:hypothetical protein
LISTAQMSRGTRFDDESKGLTLTSDRTALLKAMENKIVAIGGLGGILFGGLAAISIPQEAVLKAEGVYLANTGKALNHGVGSRPASEMLYVGGQAMFALVESRMPWWWYLGTFFYGLALLLDVSNPQWCNIIDKWKYTYLTVTLGIWFLQGVYAFWAKRYSLSGALLLIMTTASAAVEAGAVFSYNEDTASYYNTHMVAMMLYTGAMGIAVLDLLALWMQRVNGWGKPSIASSSGVTIA